MLAPVICSRPTRRTGPGNLRRDPLKVADPTNKAKCHSRDRHTTVGAPVASTALTQLAGTITSGGQSRPGFEALPSPGDARRASNFC
jgi:hypothetical protein